MHFEGTEHEFLFITFVHYLFKYCYTYYATYIFMVSPRQKPTVDHIFLFQSNVHTNDALLDMDTMKDQC